MAPGLLWDRFRIVTMASMSLVTTTVFGATTLERYYAHKAVEDEHGVIAPWSDGFNGPLDTRVRIAVEVLKRYPWVGTDKAVMAAPDFVYNSHWSIQDDGTILVPPTNDWMCGDLSQRAWSIVQGLTSYYQYSGDPIAFVYIPLTVDYILDYAQTPPEHDWPLFPIGTPTQGKAYGPCDPTARNQLDLCAIVGRETLRAYKLTANPRYLEAAKHWADVLAENCNLDPTLPPWNRYTHPEVVGWSDELTGTTAILCEFLDAVITLGHTGKDRAIVRARDAGVRYIRDRMLPRWIENDTWGRQYWDWDNPVQCGIVSMCADYILAHPDAFGNWKTDVRNMLTLIMNRNGADPGSMGDVYSGAWAWPESCTCCGTSLSYNQYTAGPTLLHYATLADDDLLYEVGRRMMIMATYDTHENGVVWDGLTGRAVATGEWSNLAHPWPLCQTLEAMKWTPELFGPRRENHIVRSSSVVNRVVYEKNRVSYSTFDAPSKTREVLRLAFEPASVTADGKALAQRPDLKANGFAVQKLPQGDYLVEVRHDGATAVVVVGNSDPQQQVNDEGLGYEGDWTADRRAEAIGNSLHVTSHKNASMTFAFVGNQVRLLGTVDPHGGLADVYLDGQKQLTLIDCWNPQPRDRQLLYSRSGLPNERHEIRIVARGQGNPISQGANLYIDAIQCSEATADADFGTGGGPTGAQRMIFGYTDRSDYIDSRGHAWKPATEWVIRTGYGTDTVAESWWTQRRSMHIANTDDAELYRYGVHGPELWANLTVGPGRYYVTLKFAETPLHTFLERTKAGGRVTHTQDVLINGRKVAGRMNVAEAAGGLFTALDRTFTDIEPRNGVIEIRLVGCDEHGAILQAVEIGPMSDAHRD
ncbi:MAG: malectin domain-containing carbohydrate-binding protein [Phycisphaerales bacterium]